MKPLSAKQVQRMENKKKKIAAFLEIAKLNDKDREMKTKAKLKSPPSGSDSMNQTTTQEDEPQRKKHKGNCKNDVMIYSTQSDEELMPGNNENESRENNKEEDQGNDRKETLFGEEFLRLKEELKMRKKVLNAMPYLRLKEAGDSALLSVEDDLRTPLFLCDIQHLIINSMVSNRTIHIPKRWYTLEKATRVSHTVVIMIEGLSVADYMENEELLPSLRDKFPFKLEVITPSTYNSSLCSHMATIPLTPERRAILLKEHGSLDRALQGKQVFQMFRAIFPVTLSNKCKEKYRRVTASVTIDSFSEENESFPSTDKFPRTHLLLSAKQMVEENYPIRLRGELAARYSIYVNTKDSYQEVTPFSPMFALDCEMCQTTNAMEVTRVSMVNEDLKVVYDSLIKPRNKIINYLTRYSGITAKMMTNVTVTLEEVQRDLVQILPSDAILVGQSLNFDLHALKMMHPYVIDTSVIFNVSGVRSRKSKLATLSALFLEERIQEGTKGHDSIEDSMASLKLVKLKLKNSIHFGDAVYAQQSLYETQWALEFEKQINERKRLAPTCSDLSASMLNDVKELGKTSAIVSNKELIKEYKQYVNTWPNDNYRVKCIKSNSSENIFQCMCEILLDHDFVLGHAKFTDDETSDPEQLKATLHSVNTWCHQIFEHVALNSLCVIMFSGRKGDESSQTSIHKSGACFINIKKGL